MVTQLDSKGYIKGTNKLYAAKVVVLKRFSTCGNIVLPGDVIEMSGDGLVSSLNCGKVRHYDPAIDDKKETPTLETLISPEENFLRGEDKSKKKLGPKKKSSKSRIEE